ncbi:MAG: hypothetical protein LQ345_000670 [Seirophora villosa]|nr:MAG: hypothetical protein LQ345_000670 [Seirophora villosa]
MPPGFIRRAVSPIHFEVLQLESDSVLCPGSDIDEDPSQRRAKKRRVEAAAQEYLRGKSLYIASARLRGPFPQGWRNPFISQEQRQRRIRIEKKQQAWQEERRRLEEQQLRSVAHVVSENNDGVGPYETRDPIASFEVPDERLEAAADPDIVQYSIEKHPDPPAERHFVKSADEPQLAKTSGSSNHEWLKISKTFAKSNLRSGHKSATPTPLPRMWDEPPPQKSARPSRIRGARSTRTSPSLQSIPAEQLSTTPAAANDKQSTEESSILAHITKEPRDIRNHRSPPHQPLLSVKEMDVNSLDPRNRQAYQTVKQLSHEAVRRAQHDWEAHLEVKKLSQEAAHRAIEASSAVKNSASSLERGDLTGDASAALLSHVMKSTHEVPPSTTLPAFEYRSRKASYSPKKRSFREDLEAAKKKARAEEKRRISFTASGRVKERRPQPPSHGSQANSGRVGSSTVLPHKGVVEAKTSGSENPSGKDGPQDNANEGTTSNQMAMLPEAQVVDQSGLNKVPSVPSAELLETEKQSLKFPSTDEGDSYLNLSTQAALQKAQQSFHRGLARSPPSSGPQKIVTSAVEAGDGDQRLYEVPHREASPSPTAAIFTPGANAEDMMSTQAMMNAMSPFAVTTAKKGRPRTDEQSEPAGSSLGPSPSLSPPTATGFRAASLSMSTTPSHSPTTAPSPPTRDEEPPPRVPLSALSKPTSSALTSFSIGPNGTMTEVLQCDGQQQPQQDYQMGDSDLDAALEEAGSFLGDWSVEKEARYLQRSTAGS